MAKRVRALTPAQQEKMTAHADRWIEIGLRTDPADFDAWEEGARRCYAAAGIEWPGVVVRVPSPLVGAFAAPVAALLIEMHNQQRRDAVHGAVGVAVGGAVRGAVHDAVGHAVHGAVDDAVRHAVGDAVGVAVGGAVRGAVGDAVRDAVHDAVDDAVRHAVGDAVRDAVHDAVHGAVGVAVRGAVGDAVRDAVHDAVGVAVHGAVGQEAVRKAVSQCWGHYVGNWWVYYQAWSTFFRDHTDLELPGDLWERSRALEQCTESASWWWPTRRFVMVSDRPEQIHREQVGPRGWGSHRLHNDSGPAISWRDGWALWFIHGTRVTEQIVTCPETLTTEQILSEPNAEVRRVMIEQYGWDRFVAAASLSLVDEAPDPANPGHTISLYDVPQQVYEAAVRVILVTNASPERDGTWRRFGLTVPAEISDAVAAVAWSFDCSADEYRQLERAS